VLIADYFGMNTQEPKDRTKAFVLRVMNLVEAKQFATATEPDDSKP
jgi:hypothetical protein